MTPNERAALAELVWELSAPHSQEDIAAYLNIEQSTVARIEHRALQKLAKQLRKDGLYEDWKDGLAEPALLQRKLFQCGASNGQTSAYIKDRHDK